MHEKTAQSLMDVLIRLMPELSFVRKNRTDPKLANILYNQIWSKESHRLSSKTFRRPVEVKQAEIDRLVGEGLVEASGNNISITDKGTHVIKSMILGDDRSIFENDGSHIDYIKATANLKPSRMSKGAKRASFEDRPSIGDNWYTRSTQTPCRNCCRRKD